MSNINDGGPAFPNTHPDYKTLGVGGMTLRDYFAAAALQPLTRNWYPEDASERAYRYADAMLAERARNGGAK